MKIENVENNPIHAKNLSAYWIPPITVQEVIHGTTYIVTGSYDGIVPFTHKLERIIARKLADEVGIGITPEFETEAVTRENTENISKDGGLPDDRIEEL